MLDAIRNIPKTIAAIKTKYSPVRTFVNSEDLRDIIMTKIVERMKMNLNILENGSKTMLFMKRVDTSPDGVSHKTRPERINPARTQ
tara:strand:- start:480 stop:737 length:258 start_codon:yes stop_codon:yes gene_type:complete